MFVDIIQIGMDHIMPVKHFKTHVNDAPWITAEFKNLIKLRQQAFNKGDKDAFSRYRNIVNRERKSRRGKYFASSGGTLSNGSQEWSPAPDQSLFFPAYIWMAI